MYQSPGHGNHSKCGTAKQMHILLVMFFPNLTSVGHIECLCLVNASSHLRTFDRRLNSLIPWRQMGISNYLIEKRYTLQAATVFGN